MQFIRLSRTLRLQAGLLAAGVSFFICATAHAQSARYYFNADGEVVRVPVKRTSTAPSESSIAAALKTRRRPATKADTSPVDNRPSWSATEIEAAQAQCARILKATKATVEHLSPIKHNRCGDPAPVKLKSIGIAGGVTFDPPATLNCAMVAALARWMLTGVQPAAKKHLGAPIKKLHLFSGYSCRNAYGRKDTKLSQHAFANALDIKGFETTDGKKAYLAYHWGITRRQIAARARAKKRAQEKALAETKSKSPDTATAKAKLKPSTPAGEKITVATKTKTSNASSSNPLASLTSALTGNSGSSRNRRGSYSALGFVEPNRLGGPKPANPPGKKVTQTASLGVSDTANAPAKSPRASRKPKKRRHFSRKRIRFLRAAFKSACNVFGTVIGPEANQTHADHFHVDLALRPTGPYCR